MHFVLNNIPEKELKTGEDRTERTGLKSVRIRIATKPLIGRILTTIF